MSVIELWLGSGLATEIVEKGRRTADEKHRR